MTILISLVSIWFIALCTWAINRVLALGVCPICAGVSGTWIWLMAAFLLGYPVDLLAPALLMGGSVVGMAYSLEKKLPAHGWRTPLLFKTLFIPAGFVASYGILVQWWGMALAALLFLLGTAFAFLSSKENIQNKKTVEDLEKKMKQCC